MSDPARFSDPGFTPSRDDIPAALDALITCEDELAAPIERALARAGLAAAGLAQSLLADAAPTVRVRLVRLLARVARETDDVGLYKALCEQLADDDPNVQRAVVIGLGKLKHPGVEDVLLVYAAREHALPELRALVEALGKCGGPRAAEWLGAQSSTDALAQRLIERAQLMLSRTVSRPEQVEPLDLSVPLAAPRTLLFTCRSGLESILREEASAFGDTQFAPGWVTVAGYAESLASALVPRTALCWHVRPLRCCPRCRPGPRRSAQPGVPVRGAADCRICPAPDRAVRRNLKISLPSEIPLAQRPRLRHTKI